MPIDTTQVQVIVWPHEPESERDDLAIPLDECGSGIGQVLSILYVVLTSDHPQVILVDEPQSFLHPGAVRKLIDVLKRYPKHQYIFATHSPAVITAADPATLTIVRTLDGESSLESIDPTNTKHLQTYLTEIGARLADVFGADNVLWAEGETEEACFPLILREIARRPLMGTAIIGIRQTGDLQHRDREKILRAYHRLSEAKTLLPPAIAIVMDQECASEEQMKALSDAEPGRVRFLPRRMYENYLLEPNAIAAVANQIEGFRPNKKITADEVRAAIEKRKPARDPKDNSGRQLRYFCKGVTDVDADWECHIHAAGVLHDVFEELSEARVEYAKTTHSVALTEWLIEHNPDKLRELSDWLVGLLGPA